MKTIRLWRGVSSVDGTYGRVIEDVNSWRFFYELAYREAMENTYFDESIPIYGREDQESH
ncbi:hypothetical protein [Escherichia coli]|uniref:hypothetical protein n=1 Tax=Escherichia coli TaxID=562 RepID=UPI0018C4D5FD|nr:hypothetical protein [Escherichia coli]